MKDYLIVGQGVAGSFLSWELLKRNKRVVIVDDHHHNSSSMISAGIINPITGKRFVATDDFDALFAHALQTYQELEEKFGQTFFETKPILRIFQNEDERDEWKRKDAKNAAQKYVQSTNPPRTYSPLISDEQGSMLITQSGFCHTARLMNAFKEYFIREKVLTLTRFAYDDLKIEKTHVRYANEDFQTVVFCEGYQSQFNPWFKWLPFNSAKGEILRGEMNGAGLPDAIINKGKWCAPIGDAWTAGATYNWDTLNCEPTEAGKKEILDGLANCVKREMRVIQHQAGVRPVMKDQKAVMGRHPEIGNLAIFNGLGSKGFLSAPYYAAHLVEFLDGKIEIANDVSIQRFCFSVL